MERVIASWRLASLDRMIFSQLAQTPWQNGSWKQCFLIKKKLHWHVAMMNSLQASCCYRKYLPVLLILFFSASENFLLNHKLDAKNWQKALQRTKIRKKSPRHKIVTIFKNWKKYKYITQFGFKKISTKILVYIRWDQKQMFVNPPFQETEPYF